MADIVLQNVSKVYDNGVKALDNLSLTVGDGELLVLVGPSGCGKTTTLRLIAGLVEPNGGTIHLGGQSLAGVPPWERNLGLVFQKPSLSPAKSVRDNLNFGNDLRRGLFGRFARLFSTASHAQRQGEIRAVAEMANLLGLSDVLDRRPAELSGGQLQRVALGRVLLRHPAAMLLDEPLGQLDGPLRRQLRRELHLLHRRFPATMIYVTHDSEEALALGQRIAVLHHGVLLQVDSAEALLAEPRYRFVAEFFPGETGPLNFLEGRLVEENGEPVFVTGPMKLESARSRREIWRKNLGRSVLLAVRPDDVCIECQQVGSEKCRIMSIALREPRTNGTLVVCEDNDLRLTSFVPHSKAVRYALGTVVAVSIRTEHGWLFDPVTGANLSL